MKNSGFKKIEESTNNYKIVGNIGGRDVEFISMIEYEALLKQAEKMAEALEKIGNECVYDIHLRKTARETLQSWKEFKK